MEPEAVALLAEVGQPERLRRRALSCSCARASMTYGCHGQRLLLCELHSTGFILDGRAFHTP